MGESNAKSMGAPPQIQSPLPLIRGYYVIHPSETPLLPLQNPPLGGACVRSYFFIDETELSQYPKMEHVFTDSCCDFSYTRTRIQKCSIKDILYHSLALLLHVLDETRAVIGTGKRSHVHRGKSNIYSQINRCHILLNSICPI